MKSKVQPSQILKKKTVSEHLSEWVQLQDERIYIIMKKTVKNRHNILCCAHSICANSKKQKRR